MKLQRVAPLVLAGLLHVTPVAMRALQNPLIPSTAVSTVLRWVVGALAVAGTYHTVSAASAVLLSPTKINGTVGTRLSYQIKINDGQNRLAESWVVAGKVYGRTGSVTTGIPPGLSMSLSTGIISGVPTQAGTYSVAIQAYEHANLSGGELSFTLTFTITGGASPPSITTQPAGGSATEGGSFTFSVVASGTGTLDYQWQHSGSSITGATGSSLTLSPLTLSDAGDYKVVVSNSGGSVTSATATLNVSPSVTPTSITTQPSNVTVHGGESFTLAVVASGPSDLHYQWQRNGETLPDSDTATLTINAATDADGGEYRVTVSGAGASVTSETAVVIIVPLTVTVSRTQYSVELQANAIPGRNYTIEATDSLGAPWVSVRDVTAEESTITYEDRDTTTAAGRFWRIRVLPQP